MTSQRRRLAQLEAASAADPQARLMHNHKAVIYRTNVTGLASLEDYRVAFEALAAENRESWCAQLPLFHALSRVGGPVTDVRMVVLMSPPGESLPAEIQHRLGHLEEVVTATGTQVLEARESTDPSREDFSVRGRQDCAVVFLALGDVEGDAIRRLAWERHGDQWRHSRYVTKLASRKGLSRAEYEEFRESLSAWLPPAGHPDVLATATAEQATSTADQEKSYLFRIFEEPDVPWISFADMARLAGQQELPDTRSDPVTSGHDEP